MKDTKKLIMLISLAVIVVIVIAISATYAFMKATSSVTSVTEVNIQSCAKLKITDNGSINLSNSYAMSRNVALKTDPYVFNVENSCSSAVTYNLYIAPLSNNTLPASDIHYILLDSSDTIVVEGILGSATIESGFTSEEIRQYNSGVNGTVGNIYSLFSTLPSINSGAVSSYKLYLYIDENATVPNGSKTFSAGLAAKSVAGN